MISTRSTAALFFTGALFSVSLAVEGPAFAPDEGSVVSREYSIEQDYQLDSFSVQVNGEDLSGMIGELEFTMRIESGIRVTDEYAALGDGRPTKLSRTFDGLESSTTVNTMTNFGGEQQDFEASSDLEGATVLFVWDEDDEEYEITFEDGESDDDLLGGLNEDMDLRVFLPEDDVSAGDSWTVELEDLAPLATPGGNLQLVPDEMEGAEDMDLDFFEEIGEDFAEEFGELFEGECVCTFKEIREKGGEKLAEIAIDIEIASAANIADMLMEVVNAIGEQFGGEAPEMDIESADINFDFDGEGTLFWNMSVGRAESFEISGEAIIGFELAVLIEAEGDSQTIEASIEMSGTYNQAAEMSE